MQNTSGILDVAIGLVFVYLLLSLICSALTEAVENLFTRSRGKKLCEGLYELFGGNTDSNTSFTLLKEFYKNPLIYGLYHGDLKLEQQPQPAGTEPSHTSPQKLLLPANLPSYIAPKTFALAFVSQILDDKPFDTATLISQINASNNLPANLKKSLTLFVNTADGDIHNALKNIEDWYSAMGERVSGWYKKHAQLIAFIIAVAIVIAGNVDTLTIAKSLMVNDNLRDQMVSSADQFIKVDLLKTRQQALDGAQSSNNQQQITQLSTEIAAIKAAASTKEALCQTQANDPQQCYNLQMARLAELNRLGLPIGWRNLDDPRNNPHSAEAWLEKIIGLFITAIAVCLGAPFWFDVLNKFMNFRSTIKPQASDNKTENKQQQPDNVKAPTPGVG